MKTLLLMRHGKSDWDAEFETDHERPINARGERSARLMGRLLTARGLAPDRVVASTAVRAATTARLAAEAGGWHATIDHEADLYSGGPDAVIEVAARGGDADRLLLVGHQPVWGLVVRKLTGAWVDVKTATVVVVGLPIDDWSAVAVTGGEVVAVLHPRDHFGSEYDD